MKAAIAIIALFFVGQAMAIPAAINGTYVGGMKVKSADGEIVEMMLETVIENGKVTSKFGETEFSMQATAVRDAAGQYAISVEGQATGRGVCMTTWCSYELELPGLVNKETIILRDGKMYRIGVNIQGEDLKIYEAVLEKQ